MKKLIIISDLGGIYFTLYLINFFDLFQMVLLQFLKLAFGEENEVPFAEEEDDPFCSTIH